jgi:hypothetical protein
LPSSSSNRVGKPPRAGTRGKVAARPRAGKISGRKERKSPALGSVESGVAELDEDDIPNELKGEP